MLSNFAFFALSSHFFLHFFRTSTLPNLRASLFHTFLTLPFSRICAPHFFALPFSRLCAPRHFSLFGTFERHALFRLFVWGHARVRSLFNYCFHFGGVAHLLERHRASVDCHFRPRFLQSLRLPRTTRGDCEGQQLALAVTTKRSGQLRLAYDVVLP